MVRMPLTACVIALAFAATLPVVAQPAQLPSEATEASLVGLAVYSSDGQRLGDVTDARMAGNQLVIRAEFGNVLGIGPIVVIIPAALFVQKADLIEVSMTAAEVRDRIVEQQRLQQQLQQQKR